MRRFRKYIGNLIVVYQLVRIVFSKKSYLKEKGFISSVRKGIPVNSAKQPVPWMNYSFLDFLTPRLSTEMNIFEYGSGFSTLYFQSKVKSIKSVEYDRKWYDEICYKTASNVEVLFCARDNSGNYAGIINQDANMKFDIVFIDGADRINCIKQSIGRLTPGGVIILDDSQRSQYYKGFEYMKSMGFRDLTIGGIKPATIEKYETTIFYKSNNVLNI